MIRPVAKDEMVAVAAGGTMGGAALDGPESVEFVAQMMADSYLPHLPFDQQTGAVALELTAAFHAGLMMGLQVAEARS